MRKLVFGPIAVGLALLLAGCTATAGATGHDKSTAPERVTVQFRVNGEVTASGVEAFQTEGRLYVPISKIGYTTDRFVQWDKEKGEVVVQQRAAAPRTPSYPAGPAETSERIKAALDLLQQKDPEHYQLVLEHVQFILPGDYNQAFAGPNVVTLSQLREAGVPWAAARLVHEAEHLRIAHTDPALAKDIKGNERAAYQVSLDVLKRLGGTPEQIAAEEKSAQDPPTWESVIK